MEHTLPQQLLQSLERIESFNKEDFKAVHANAQQVTSIRFNAEKYQYFHADETIAHPTYSLQNKVPWCETGFYLEYRPQFTFDPLLHAGVYYVQEASSLFLWNVLQQLYKKNAPCKVLDLCAAPGGKSTLLQSYFTNSLIVSNEIIKSRANILYKNCAKWGSANSIMTNNDPADFKRLPYYFDLMVIDAPCSGSGLFRKDANAINEWSESNVELCSFRQKRILADVYDALKKDGFVIYSTCSYSQQEDEDIADWLLDNFKLNTIQIKLNSEWNIDETQSSKHNAFGYRFWPNKLKGEGFFIAVFQKKENNVSSVKYEKSNQPKINSRQTALAATYLQENDFHFFAQQEILRALPKQWSEEVALFQKKLYLKKAGIQLGAVKGNDFVPHHELALSTIINKHVQRFELSQQQALNYLRKKEINIDTDYKGWALSTYQKFPLGWMKILHNRVNNYYPTEWRILKE